MPELPEVELYVRALRARILDRQLLRLEVLSPSLLRTFDPPAGSLEGLLDASAYRSLTNQS